MTKTGLSKCTVITLSSCFAEEDGTTNAAAATLANPVMGMDAKDDGTTYEDQFLSSDQDADQSVDESKTEPEVPKYRSSASQQRRSPTFVRLVDFVREMCTVSETKHLQYFELSGFLLFFLMKKTGVAIVS